MEVPINQNVRFVCLEYPGVVQSVEKMLQTLGGEVNVSKTFLDPTRRMELRFRPDDLYCKPACGDRQQVTNLLLRVRRRKQKRKSGELDPNKSGLLDNGSRAAKGKEIFILSNTSGRESRLDPSSENVKANSSPADTAWEYQGQVLGVINTVYRFQGMADFQYLPMERQEDNTYVTLMEKLIVNALYDRSWLQKDAPLFLPPPIFSRIDNAVDYAYRDGPKPRTPSKDPVQARPSNLIGISRRRRPHYTLFAQFEDKVIPKEPLQEAVVKVASKVKDMTNVEELRKLFQNRPIWSKNALKSLIDMSPEHMKYALPTIAYYFVTGPWRSLWVKLGYDPRTDTAAKIYQLVDFRVRQKSAADSLKINTKRSTYRYNLPNTVNKSAAQAALIQYDTFNVDWSNQNPDNRIEPKLMAQESTWKFRPGMVPAYRQMFYQLCDVEEDSVQKMLHSNDKKESECTERDGWCIPDIQDKVRQILLQHLRDSINKEGTIADVTLSQTPAQTKKKATKRKSKVQAESETSDSDVEDYEEFDDEEEEPEEEDDGNEMETEMLNYMAPEAALEQGDPT